MPEEYLGVVIEKLGPRRGEMIEMKNPGQGLVRLTLPDPGARAVRLPLGVPDRHPRHRASCTTGSWTTARGPGRWRAGSAGCWWPTAKGSVVAFALGNLQERAQMFVAPGDPVYEGMIVGENSRPGDMDVNVTKEKKLTNMRTTAIGREHHAGAAARRSRWSTRWSTSRRTS